MCIEFQYTVSALLLNLHIKQSFWRRLNETALASVFILGNSWALYSLPGWNDYIFFPWSLSFSWLFSSYSAIQELRPTAIINVACLVFSHTYVNTLWHTTCCLECWLSLNRAMLKHDLVGCALFCLHFAQIFSCRSASSWLPSSMQGGSCKICALEYHMLYAAIEYDFELVVTHH